MWKYLGIPGLLLACALLAQGREGGVRVGTAEGVLFSDFDKTTGSLLWELGAVAASPEGGGVSSIGDTGVWLLRTVTLKTYSKGKLFATIRTPDCRYVKAEKTASSSSALSMDSAAFWVNGENWSWTSGADNEVVKLQKKVAVTLKPTATRGEVHIFSDRLEATMSKRNLNAGRTDFVFLGNVRVLMKGRDRQDVLLESDTLTVRLKNTGTDKMGAIAAVGASGGGSKSNDTGQKELDALEDITANGNVRITSQGRRMLGDTSSYVQASGTFTTSGNARVEDPQQNVSVMGGKIIYRHEDDKIDVLGQDVVTDGIPVKMPVILRVPSFILRENTTGRQTETALISGEHLIITLKEDTNHIELIGNVRVLDEKFELKSGRLFVETPHDNVMFADARKARVNSIVAEEAVTADYDDSVLKCGRAVIDPEKNTIFLTGTPEIEKGGVKLKGHAMLMEKARRVVTVDSAPPNAPQPVRVQVSLPPLKTLNTQRVEGKGASPVAETMVSSDKLVMTEKPGDVAEFDFSGNVMLQGANLDGRCNWLGIRADTRRRTPAERTTARGGTVSSGSLEMIHNITAVGSVRLATDTYVAEGGRAVILPRVALQEHSPKDDNGMDGREPQFLTLEPHSSTPGFRPRITLLSSTTLTVAALPGTAPEATPENDTGPVTIESDLLEIVGGNERSRFFLRGNVVLTGKSIDGRCETVEGSIVQDKLTTPKQGLPVYSVSRIIGRNDVRFNIQGNKATGDMFEMLPLEQKIYLTGAPRVQSRDGVQAIPGKRIIYDWGSKNWKLEGDVDQSGIQVARPRIRVPLRGNWKYLPTDAVSSGTTEIKN